MKECKHQQYIEVYPQECFIHRKLMPKNETKKIKSIRIRICFDCGKIIEVVDYGE